MITKECLMRYNCFVQNEYFEKYFELVERNKGKTKYTDERILRYSTSSGGVRSHFKPGNMPWNTGKHFSSESIEKMRYAAKHRKRKVGKTND